ncbi:MAG: aminoacyl-tRNA hydrolase [Candidatus Dojkabacteria bacterium]|nr:MAG: aminoacyl-tRNA hydrolase [Candidatus Dojkabacteria bacterium]
MKLLVGLGNPGKEFENTPHNAGFLAIDVIAQTIRKRGYAVEEWKYASREGAEIAEVYSTQGERFAVLVKPQTYMNLSGSAVQKIMRKYGVKDQRNVLIIYDELDIELGKYKYSPLKNSRTHKGIASVLASVGTQVQSLRIGVDNRGPVRKIPGETYVLKKYSVKEQEVLHATIAEAIPDVLAQFAGLV